MSARWRLNTEPARVSFSCDDCHIAFWVACQPGTHADQIAKRVEAKHQEMQPACPRKKAFLSSQKSYLGAATPHFKMELNVDTVPFQTDGPLIIIGR